MHTSSALKEVTYEKEGVNSQPRTAKKAILAEFLESLERLDTLDLDVDFAFINDFNDHDLLNTFAKGKNNAGIFTADSKDSYLCSEITHQWQEDLIWKVAGFRKKQNAGFTRLGRQAAGFFRRSKLNA